MKIMTIGRALKILGLLHDPDIVGVDGFAERSRLSHECDPRVSGDGDGDTMTVACYRWGKAKTASALESELQHVKCDPGLPLVVGCQDGSVYPVVDIYWSRVGMNVTIITGRRIELFKE